MISYRSKIKTINELSKIFEDVKAMNRRIVHCHGVFDLLHIGHIRYFNQARNLGDVLLVTITPDCYVDKGPHRPAFTENLRAEAIASLACVDFVAINEWPTAEETLRRLRPNVYVKGSEFKDTSSDPTGKIGLEERVVREIGAELRFTEDIVFSSSNLINKYLSNFSQELEEYLGLFRSRYTLEQVLGWLERISGIKTLVIGDAIIDEYHYCEAIGKSSKDPCLVMKYQNHDIFAGGALAVANHVASFSNEVDLVTNFGDVDDYQEFARGKLSDNVRQFFFKREGAPSVVKRRYVDGYSFSKLYEVYVIDDSPMPESLESTICSWLLTNLLDYDLVIVADFGHGMVTKRMIHILCQIAKRLALMTQANAGNRGFNTITKYPRADFICIAEHEIRLERRDLHGRLRPMMTDLAKLMNVERFIVTRGRKGCAIGSRDDEFAQIPSLASLAVDRVGAGDAFFAITSLLDTVKAENEILGFIGNVAGSIAIQTIGNAKPVDKLSCKKFITALMK